MTVHAKSDRTGMLLGRRRLMQGVAGLPLAAVLADPLLARAAAAGLQEVEIEVPGHGRAAAALALPAAERAPAVMLIHEWWGLNDQIKAVAAELARAGHVALAIDLFDGQVATSADAARAQIQALDAQAARATTTAWLNWLARAEQDGTARGNGRLATLGWCFGGAWSLQASLARPVDATVIYYGRVGGTAEELQALKGPVQGHFGTRDQSIDAPMVEAWTAAMDAAGKPYEVFWYDADHAFANPTGARYDQADAKLAWERTLAFLNAQLTA